MTLEFMTGATVFALINLLFLLVTIYLLVRGIRKYYVTWKETGELETAKFPREFYFLLAIGVLFVLFGSVAQPKLAIDPVQNRALIEYQESNEEIVIETPPSRTETLEGFTPLKQ